MTSETVSKKHLRATLLAEREAIDSVLQRQMADEMGRLVLPWILANGIDQVFAFVSHRGEPDLLPTLGELLPSDTRLALPVITGRGSMRFYEHEVGDSLTANRHGILEPAPVRELLPSPQTLMLVPCVACDHSGYRLGYGGGFYDRYLAAHPAVVSMGIVYARFFLNKLPMEAHDQPLTAAVTETGITFFREQPALPRK